MGAILPTDNHPGIAEALVQYMVPANRHKISAPGARFLIGLWITRNCFIVFIDFPS